jgi:hypothetical protein
MNTHTPDLEARPVAADLSCIAREFAAIPHLSLRRHDGNELREEIQLPLTGRQQAGFGGAQWLCTTRVRAVAGRLGTFDLEVTFAVTAGHAAEVGTAVGITCGEWSPDNHVLLPGAVYRGNDFAVSAMPYPPMWTDPAMFRADMPTTITDLPRLSGDSLRIEQTTGDVSTPGMGFQAPARRQGILMLTGQATRFGNSGLTVETTADRSGCMFLVTAPCVREFRQGHCSAVPGSDRAAGWHSGDEVTIRLRLCFFDAPRLQDLFDQLAAMRKDLNPAVRCEELPFSAAWEMLEAKYHRDNWVESPGYFKMAPNANTTSEFAEDPLCFLWQLGWVGGGMVTLPLLFQGTELSRVRAWRNLEMIFDRTQAPSGFFHGIGDGTNFFSDGFDRPFPHGLHLIRKSADWLFYAIKHFDLLRKQGREIPAPWLAAIRKLADAFVKLWRAEGQFGQFVNVETGALLVGGSCAAAIAPAGLAMAAGFFNDPRYLEIAEAAAQRYCHEYVAAGFTTGGPSEILSAPDSESAFALLESLVKLHEVTGSERWLEEAGKLARQAATWVVSYDYRFPPGSDLDRSGARTTGAVIANVQNKHAAPAICTHSGDALFRLWRATGDPLALDLISDIAHGIPQYMSREDRPLNQIMQPGWICERVNLSDWEGAEAVGGNHFGSTWPEVSLMLTTIEIPGLYVQPDTGFFHAFDHVEVTRIRHADGRLSLKLSNPTGFDATIKVLCESSAGRCLPLTLNALFGVRRIWVPAGESVVAEFISPFQSP